jgi:RNA polymerase sigma-B factor
MTWPSAAAHDGELERLLTEAAGADGRRRDELRERAVLAAMPMAHAAARRYRHGDALEDLQQVAAMALVKAVQGFRPDAGVPFVAYAMPTIHGELKRHLRDHGWHLRPPRRLQELRLAVGAAVPGLTQQLHRDPTTAEIAQALGVLEDEVREAVTAAAGMTPPSLDEEDRDTRATAVDDLELDRLVNWQGVLPALDARPERERRAVAMYFFGGVSQARIGTDLGISQVQVSRLITEVLRQVREGDAAADAWGRDPARSGHHEARSDPPRQRRRT